MLMPKRRGRMPTAADKCYHVRFCSPDQMTLEREAESKGLAVTALLRVIVLEWLDKERGK